MRYKNTISALVAGACIIAGCKKSDKTLPANEDGCVVQRGIEDGTVIEGQYIVALNSPPGARVLSTEATGQTGVSLLKKNNILESALQQSFTGGPGGFIARLTGDELERLRSDQTVQAIEPDRIIALSTCFTVAAPLLITWNVKQVGYGDGTGKTAWIIDSGIDLDHPDLNVDISRSRSFLSGSTSPDDENGHGTHVAGIIGAKNNTIGVLGVASGASLVSLRVLGKDGEGPLSGILQALSYVSSNGKAGDVVNLSLSEDGPSNILDQTIQSVAGKGILFAVAAGNDHKPANQFSPGRANGPNIFTVSAVDSSGNLASFSNYGNDVVDYAAPGVGILSTYTNGRYARMSGTSMAAPHVAGLLLLSRLLLR